MVHRCTLPMRHKHRVGCKTSWEDDHHRCADSNEPGVKPDWLPVYSATCRIKQCPYCRLWIEHKEACNHMTCCYCRHEFYFVCELPWDGNGFHDDESCPSYGDRVAGYDDESFEKTDRGLHRDTGYSRSGLDRQATPTWVVLQVTVTTIVVMMIIRIMATTIMNRTTTPMINMGRRGVILTRTTL